MYSLPKLRGAELFYSELSILEAMWKAVKIVKKEDLDLFISLEDLR
jgi:hypothetical protein